MHEVPANAHHIHTVQQPTHPHENADRQRCPQPHASRRRGRLHRFRCPLVSRLRLSFFRANSHATSQQHAQRQSRRHCSKQQTNPEGVGAKQIGNVVPAGAPSGIGCGLCHRSLRHKQTVVAHAENLVGQRQGHCGGKNPAAFFPVIGRDQHNQAYKPAVESKFGAHQPR